MARQLPYPGLFPPQNEGVFSVGGEYLTRNTTGSHPQHDLENSPRVPHSQSFRDDVLINDAYLNGSAHNQTAASLDLTPVDPRLLDLSLGLDLTQRPASTSASSRTSVSSPPPPPRGKRWRKQHQLPLVKFRQLNLHKSMTPTREIMRLCSSSGNRPFIAMLQEPSYNQIAKYGPALQENDREYRVNGLGNRGLYYFKKKGHIPRAAILAAPGMDLLLDPTFTNKDTVTCKWTTYSFPRGRLQTTEIYLCSNYWPREEGAVPDKLQQLIIHCYQNRQNLVIGMDSNAHHQSWFNPQDDGRGQKLFELLTSHDMHVLNNSPEPTFWQACRTEFLSSSKNSVIQFNEL